MTKYLCIAGDALNWAWSLRDYKSDVLSNSFKDKRPPPDFLNKIKDSENILWAFNDSKIYEKLKRIVDE
ncbi:MAG TPA: hypothetical protein ENG40_04115, partial [Thermoprotei archaeon]|nr:hypothetical protein [Thermoprotei archaeon]